MSVYRTGLLLLALLASTARAEDIIVLLPQTGHAAKAGAAVRDGLLAAYYQTGGARNASLALIFRDSGTPPDPGAQIASSLTPETRLVIGPLLRDQVSALLASPPAVPVLALNQAGGLQVPGIWEFALTPEDELGPLADLMRQEGIQRVRILLQPDEAAQRIRQSFEMAWEARGGQVLPAHTFQEGEQGGISASLRQMIADPQGSRAQAYFLASPGLALQVLPLLAFYQKKPAPVYSVSGAFDETAPLLQRRDLNGLRFCAPPWIIENRWPEQTLLATSSPPESGSYNRLHAFGADAWSLQRLLPARKPHQLSLRTGRMTLDPQGLQRTPECMEIQDGTPRPVTPGQRPGR